MSWLLEVREIPSKRARCRPGRRIGFIDADKIDLHPHTGPLEEVDLTAVAAFPDLETADGARLRFHRDLRWTHLFDVDTVEYAPVQRPL